MLDVLRKVMGLTGYVLLGIVVLTVVGSIYQTVGLVADERRFAPPGRLVDVGEGHLHIHCSGKGSPTVVLDAGGGGSSLTWYLVQADLARRTRVCSFDRMGFGWSDSLPRPHTASEYVALQRALLENAGISGKYILVGHSLGGLNAQLFARRHQEKVVGLVLVDSAHEELFERIPEFEGVDRSFLKAMRVASRVGIVRLVLALGLVDPLPRSAELPRELRAMVRAELARPRQWDATYEMNKRLLESTTQVRKAGSLPEVPLVVITHGNSSMFGALDPAVAAEAERVWQELQAELAQRVRGGRLVVAEQSGHMIPFEQPELVVEGVESVLDAVRERQ